MLRFDSQVAIVTGSGAGIGRCYALLFAERGAKVVVNDCNREAADSVIIEIKAKGGAAVADYNSVMDGDKVVATAIDNFGRVDILVNNAGILRDVSFAKMTKAHWNQVLDVHLQGTFAVTHAAWPYMRKQKYGRIIVITSVNGLYGQFGQVNYCSMKAAMTGFGKALAKEGARSNIKMNIVAPGAGSKMTESILPAELVAKWKPEYVAPTVAFLCHESVPCSGKIFESGGGFVAQVKYVRSAGVFFDLEKEITPEAVQAKFSSITDFSHATDPDDDKVTPQLQQILNAKL
ncbi:putative short-chain dehydrogenase/reductase SDR, NAD(P)-binding domain superfamily [Plasmopara halstedii]